MNNHNSDRGVCHHCRRKRFVRFLEVFKWYGIYKFRCIDWNKCQSIKRNKNQSLHIAVQIAGKHS
jgi:hypothetical protein